MCWSFSTLGFKPVSTAIFPMSNDWFPEQNAGVWFNIGTFRTNICQSRKLHINNDSVCVITLTTRRGRQKSGPTGLSFKLIGLIRTESCPGCHACRM